MERASGRLRRALRRRIVAVGDNAVRRWAAPAPSFAYKLGETGRLRRRERAASPAPRPKRNPPSDKEELKAWAADLGVRCPRTVQVAERVERLDWDSLPETFVVKPRTGASSRGVFIIERRGAGLFSVRDDAFVTPRHISGAVAEAAQQYRYHSIAVVVEERVERFEDARKPPFDWKALSFHGRVGLIAQRDPAQQPPRWKYYGPDGNPVGRVRYDRPFDGGLPPPRDFASLRSAAEIVSAQTPYPFARVDLYEDDDGPLLGEVALEADGVGRYRADVDRRLGELWEDAEIRLRTIGRFEDRS